MTRWIVALIAALGIAVGVAAPAAAQDGHDLRIVTIEDTNLYAEASLDAEVLTVIPEGTELYYQHNVSGTGFMYMSYDGHNGWIELDSFVSYDDYYGTDDGTDDVETLPVTGAGSIEDGSGGLPLLAFTLLGVVGVAGLTLKAR